jgi:mycofactocin precursor
MSHTNPSPATPPVELAGTDTGSPVEPKGGPEPKTPPEDELVEADLLVEDISIDGMCGVY